MWGITDLDGVISHAQFMDERPIRPDAKPPTLTEALTGATTTTGRVEVISSSATGIDVKIDIGADGEFEYDAQLIAIRQ